MHEVGYGASQNITEMTSEIYIKNEYSLWQEKKTACGTQWLVPFLWECVILPSQRAGPLLLFLTFFFFLTELAKARACDMVLKIFFPL